MSIKRMKLTGAAILVSRDMKVLQAAPAAYPYRSLALLRRDMKVNEFSKPMPAPGFFARLFGETVNSYALAIVFGAETVEQVEAENSSAKTAIKDWAAKRDHKDFVMVTAFAEQPICDAIETGMTKLCRKDAEVAPLLNGIRVELSFNAGQKKLV